MTARTFVLAASTLPVVAGLVAVAVQFVVAGGGGYSDFFFLLGFAAIGLTLWAAVAIARFARKATTSVQPLTASVLALVALAALALAIGLRG